MHSFSGVIDYRRGGQISTDIDQMAKTTKQDQAAREIARLKQELECERLRADLWQKMIEVAEEELQLDIQKKFGAKQSPDSNK